MLEKGTITKFRHLLYRDATDVPYSLFQLYCAIWQSLCKFFSKRSFIL